MASQLDKETLPRARFWRLALFVAIAFAVVMACLPEPPRLPGDPSDKLVHMAAFAVLTLLARIAYPRASAWYVMGAMALLGAAIEFLQSLPAIGREPSLADWIADVFAIGFVLAMAGVSRALFRPTNSPS